ncbi:hypothetical protein [Leptolyngbya sp. NIES-2104]|nr:hypothetical protein [Leptolyngbya sp. NIES-2104]GAP96105.1 hypothetical protein NIES2104_26400 [Leptolyngbya sp. NIES-2104]
MTPEQRNDLIGAILVAIAVLYLAPILPAAIDFLAVRIHQDFVQGREK